MRIEEDVTLEKIYIKKIRCDEKLRIFFSLLSERDSLIARLIYFTDKSVTEVIQLRREDCYNLILPSNLHHDLRDYIEDRKEDELVFQGHKGQLVDRAHINQAFTRASRNMKCNYKITPGELRKWEPKGAGVS